MHNTAQQLILIIAGEASGDHHGAKLVKDIKQHKPNCSFIGIGGSQLQAEGMEIVVNANQLGIVGITEVFAQLPTILNALSQIKHILKSRRPDLVILIDFPDFNFRVAKMAKKLGIKVLYYISPQLWAWRSGRIKTIKRYVDHMAVVFPFEVELYRSKQVPVTYVGHPLTNTVCSQLSKLEARQAFNLGQDNFTVGLLPGSRKAEIKRLLPVMLDAATLLKQKHPSIQFSLPLASTLSEDDLKPYLNKHELPLQIVKERTYDVMRACDAAITVSGTVTLEAALMQLPMVVIYKVSNFSYFLGKCLINIPYISLTNIVAKQHIVPELMQSTANASSIAFEVERILLDTKFRNEIKSNLAKVKESLVSNIKEQSVAKIALDLLNS